MRLRTVLVVVLLQHQFEASPVCRGLYRFGKNLDFFLRTWFARCIVSYYCTLCLLSITAMGATAHVASIRFHFSVEPRGTFVGVGSRTPLPAPRHGQKCHNQTNQYQSCHDILAIFHDMYHIFYKGVPIIQHLVVLRKHRKTHQHHSP